MPEDLEQAKQSEWVKVISKRDGHSFIVPRDVAMGSGFLRNSLNPDAGFIEGQVNTCEVDDRYAANVVMKVSLLLSRAIIVEKVMEYLAHKHLYAKVGPREEIPDFQERIPPDIALELYVVLCYCACPDEPHRLMAADFLEGEVIIKQGSVSDYCCSVSYGNIFKWNARDLSSPRPLFQAVLQCVDTR